MTAGKPMPAALRPGKDPDARDKSAIIVPGVATMRPDSGTGLPPPPKVHRHNARNAKRSRRAR